MKKSKLDFSQKQCNKCKGYFNEGKIDAHIRLCVVKTSEERNNKRSVSPSPGLNSLNKKVSTGDNSKRIEKEPKHDTKLSPTKKTPTINGPISLICFLCGKMFGTSSLEIHLKSCKNTWISSKKSVDPDSLRPEILVDIIELTKLKKVIDLNLINQYNQEAEKNFRDTNYNPCKYCGRKFPEEKLQIHLKGCEPKPGVQTSKHVRVPSQIGLHSRTPSQNNLNKSVSETSLTTKKLSNMKSSENIKQGSTVSNGVGIMGFGQKPNLLICFICGREFGKYSLEIHLKSCKEKNLEAEEKSSKLNQSNNNFKYPEELESIFSKLSLNEDVSVNEILNYNEIANQIFRQNTMKPCINCNRRFLPDRLEVHLRSCKSSTQSTLDTKRPLSPGPGSRPKMLICPLCGREFGTLSLPIHLKSCKERHELEQQKLPKNHRRSAEDIINKYNQIKNQGNLDIQNLNNDVLQMWNDDVLVPCENCGRTFLPDRLQVHLRSCKKK